MTQSIGYEIVVLDPNEIKAKTDHEINVLIEKKIQHLQHGDVVVTCLSSTKLNDEKHFSEAKFHLLCEISSDINNNEKYMCDLSQTSNGDKCIPLEISKSIVKNQPEFNLIEGYLSLLQKKFKNYKNKFKAIELDFKIHAELLPKSFKLPDKVENKAKLYYYFENPSNMDNNNNNNKNNEITDGNFFVSFDNENNLNDKLHALASNFDNIEFYDDEAELNDEKLASSNDNFNNTIELREKLLNEEEIIDEKDRDLEVEDFAQRFRLVYENQFKEYLKTLKTNQTINATSLPIAKYNKDTYEQDSMNSTTLMFYFKKLELDENGNINAIEATTFDKSESCHFQPFLCNAYGPYFKTTLYTCYYNVGRKKNSQAEHFFVDLPIHLYNLIESDD